MANPDFGKMVGPLPLGAWVAVVGGGFLFMVYQKKQAAIAPAAVATTDPAQAATDPNLTGAGGSGQFVDVTPPSTAVNQPITDNNSWGTAAVNWLIAQGYDPIVSDSAIRKYLDQESGYSSQEFALVRLAIGHLGATPEVLPAPVFGKPVVTPPKPPTTKPPVTKPPTKKPAPKPHVRYYTVRPGDNLTRIGNRYHIPWQHIYNANKAGQKRADGSRGMISNYNVIRPGWHLIIPNS